mmetsp:Transcript_18447/g.56374  ORF Transcript_18447/g.56374 Transcript_18447/m.56374 type:complete len:309 (-) Transcript_18447:343-1269(-)
MQAGERRITAQELCQEGDLVVNAALVISRENTGGGGGGNGVRARPCGLPRRGGSGAGLAADHVAKRPGPGPLSRLSRPLLRRRRELRAVATLLAIFLLAFPLPSFPLLLLLLPLLLLRVQLYHLVLLLVGIVQHLDDLITLGAAADGVRLAPPLRSLTHAAAQAVCVLGPARRRAAKASAGPGSETAQARTLGCRLGAQLPQLFLATWPAMVATDAVATSEEGHMRERGSGTTTSHTWARPSILDLRPQGVQQCEEGLVVRPDLVVNEFMQQCAQHVIVLEKAAAAPVSPQAHADLGARVIVKAQEIR